MYNVLFINHLKPLECKPTENGNYLNILISYHFDSVVHTVKYM